MSAQSFVTLVAALAWPLVALAGFLIFRKPLIAFLEKVAARATKVSAFNVAIEIADLPKAAAWSGPAFDDFRAAQPAVANASTPTALFEAISASTGADYLTIDLHGDRSWLTSRVYILAALIPRVRRIERIVFLRDPGETFVGIVSPEEIRRRFAFRYPHLEEAFLRPRFTVAGGPQPTVTFNREVIAPNGPLAPFQARQVMTTFLGIVKQPAPMPIPIPPPGPAPAVPPVAPKLPEGWMELAPGVVEHAEWLSSDLLRQILGTALQVESVVRDPRIEEAVTAKTLLRFHSRFIPIVDTTNRFLYVVDRNGAVDAMVRRELERNTGGA